MSIKKSLLALAATALASMAFASMASASGGTLRHVTSPFNPMPVNTTLHYVGWAKFSSGVIGSYECHVTAETNSTGTGDVTANVTSFTVPDTTKCTGTGVLAPCTLAGHNLDATSPTVTATATDFDVLGLKVFNLYSGCSTTSATLDFTGGSSFITLKPLKTGTRVVTGTSNTLGTTAATGATADPIAGVEVEGKGIALTNQHIIFVPTERESEITVSGELEITPGHRCTWKLVTS